MGTVLTRIDAMPRAEFHHDLQALQDDLLVLGSMVEKAIQRSLVALRNRDRIMAEEIVRDDDIIDDKQEEIEERCIDLIATQQPMAVDLRVLVTVIHLGIELERMGDYAEGIAKIALMMGDEPPLKPLIDIPRMADMASDMLRRSLDAFVDRDVNSSMMVRQDDDVIDALYEQVYRELLTFMLGDPTVIRRATYLLWAAHNIERIADRTTNIAENVIYMVTGERIDVVASPTS